jgi:hypothetical protein
VPYKNGERHKFSVSLSDAGAALVHELRVMTDADTDSEVFRNAIRFHAYLMRRVASGEQIRVGDEVIALPGCRQK